MATNSRPDTDFQYRVVSGYDGRRLTWHSMECATGKNAKYSRRTTYTPETRREALKANSMKRYGFEMGTLYDDHMARCCLGRSEAQAASASPKFTKAQARSLFANAHLAGLAAGNGATPTPMVVGTPTSILSNDIDHSKRTYYVSEGACGFAWVLIHPGGSSLARQARALGVGSRAYGGGVSIWVHDHGQSVDRKERHAHAYASVLREHGVEAFSQSRLD
jgi:hypothetical protein